jgi:CRISPR-associated protein (TIGR03986 family)
MIKEEKATLKVFLSKKKNKIVEVTFADGKSMPVNGLVDIPSEANEKDALVKREGGKIIEITVEGKRYGLKHSPNKQPSTNPSKAPTKPYKKENKREPSRAPYNFIPLNDAVVESEHGNSVPGFGSYKDGLLSGYIDLTIDAKTPVYIRRVSDKSEFFEIGGRSLIPGSTIRGLTKNIMKIASFAKFQEKEDFEDRNLYYRAVGDQGSIGNYYKSSMVDANDNYFPKVKAGILRKRGREYIISPSSENEGTQFYRINGTFDGTGEHFKISFKAKTEHFDCFSFSEIYFKPVMPKTHTHIHNTKKGPITILLKYALIETYSKYPKEDLKKGYLILSGKSPRKHMQWVINTADTEKPALAIPQHVIEDYEQDKSRSSANLLKMLEKENEVPCFYLTDEEGNITDFGHTALFRKRYSLSVGDHVPKELNPEKDANNVSDIVEAIFGKLEHWTGRVYFEDAELQSNGANVFMDEATLKILSSPKPTCFQHYL